MPWQPFSSPEAFVSKANLSRADPYLAWAEATAFRNFARDGAPPTMVPVIVELKQGKTPSDLAAALGPTGSVARAYRALDTRYCTANFSAAACTRFAAANDVVERFEFTLPVLSRRPFPMPPAPASLRDAGQPLSSGDTLLVVIDDGCPFAHANFRRASSTRLLAIWDQDSRPAFGLTPAEGRLPNGFDYGREVDRSMLDAIIARATRGATIDEDACYEIARYPQLRRRATHAAHVLDQFVGPRRLADRISLLADEPPSWKTSRRAPAELLRASDVADVVFIQLPRDAWSDPAGNALASCVLDGLRYAMARAGSETKQIVVNISCAIYTGPHNGSSIFEKALQEMATPGAGGGPAVHVFMPTGNSFNSAWRAGATLAADARASVRLRIPPSSEVPTFVQVWCSTASGAPQFTVRAPGPNGCTSARMAPGAAQNMVRNEAVVASAIHTRSESRGRTTGTGLAQSSLFLLAVDPTRTIERPGCNAPYGDWTIEVTAESETEVHVYVARNESELGAPLRGRAARLIDDAYDPNRFLRAETDDPPGARLPIQHDVRGALIPILRRGTISGVASGAGVWPVAGLYLRPKRRPVSYSSAGSPDPHAAAVCHESCGLPGIRGAGSRSGSVVRLQGTSFACPQRARAKADGVVSAFPKPMPSEDPPRAGRWGREDGFVP